MAINKTVWNKDKTNIYSEEALKKMSIANKGKHLSIKTEFKKGMIPWNKDKTSTEETRQKMSKALKGKKLPPRSEEHRRKISEYMKGKHASENTKQKISESLKGKCGEKSRNWKGGLTPLALTIRHSFEYRQWRSDIFTKDNFICQKCGQLGGRLNAHHIKPFASILQYYEITTLEESLECDELWNINNGITLCKECHRTIGGDR